jgi:hypothetical protein
LGNTVRGNGVSQGSRGLNVGGLNVRGLNVRGLNVGGLNNLLDRLLNVGGLNNLLDGLLNVLDGLLNVLDGGLDNLLNLLDGLLDDLSFNSLVFNSFLNSFNGNVFSISVLVNLRNIFDLVFNGVVVGDLSFSGNVFNSFNSFVFEDGFFIGNVFDSALASNGCLLYLDGGNRLD